MKLAGIQYMGLAGLTQECQEAIMRLIQFGDDIKKVQILTSTNAHALLLTVGDGDLIAIKSGFASGYGGKGPHSFSYILQLLWAYCDEIYEYEVDNALMVRLDKSALTKQDIAKIKKSKYIHGRWPSYIFESDFEKSKNGTLWEEFPSVVPLSIIDNRIADLAISFWENPDHNILTGYRRLEDIIRARTKLDQHGAKLFQQAFIDNPKLQWKYLHKNEQIGRGNLFISAYGAHRNSRAHKEIDEHREDQLSELLLLNHLYRLEKEASKTRAKKARKATTEQQP
jgi:hypothetical protein